MREALENLHSCIIIGTEMTQLNMLSTWQTNSSEPDHVGKPYSTHDIIAIDLRSRLDPPPMRSEAFHISFGVHSNIPTCCIAFWINEFCDWPISKRTPYVQQTPSYGYIPCPACVMAGRNRQIHLCDPAHIDCWQKRLLNRVGRRLLWKERRKRYAHLTNKQFRRFDRTIHELHGCKPAAKNVA